MPRAFSSGALSIWSYALNSPPCALRHHLRQRRRQRRLAVVNVTDRAHVHVRLGAFEFFLSAMADCLAGHSDEATGCRQRGVATIFPRLSPPRRAFRH
jgi:hypothetical protein